VRAISLLPRVIGDRPCALAHWSHGDCCPRSGQAWPYPRPASEPSLTARHARLRSAAAARGIPLPAIVTTCAVVVAIYLAGKVAYRMRDVLLMIVVGGFIALLLNPMVGYVQRRVPRRGAAVAIVLGWATLVFIGLAVLFGYPLVNGLTHFSARLPSYVADASAGHGWIGHLARQLHLQQWVASNAPKLETLGRAWPGRR